MQTIVIVFLSLVLVGCAGQLSLVGTSQPNTNALQHLATFTLADLANADADAVAHNDQIAHLCYPALTRFVTDLQGQNANGTVSGAFSAFQKARDIANQVNAGLPQYLIIGCSPLFVDANAMLTRLAAVGL